MRGNLQSFLGSSPDLCKRTVVSAAADAQLRVMSAKVMNRSGGAIDIGILKKLNANSYDLRQLLAASTPDAQAVSSAIKAGTAQTIFTTTNNDGFLVQSKEKFSVIGFNIAQASTGSPVYTVEYYNGSAYATVTPIVAPAYASTGEKIILLIPPIDWAVGTTAAVGGDTDKYSIKVIATTAPSQAVTANDLWVGGLLDFQEGAADNTNLSKTFVENKGLLLEAGEGIMGFFATASASNLVSVDYYEV